MDAKIAAAKVQSDLQNLSDEELIEVYSSLKGKDEYKVQFNKLMHQAGKRLKGILEKMSRNRRIMPAMLLLKMTRICLILT